MENTIETQPRLVWELVRLADMREVAQEAIDYARQHNLTLQVYDPHVWQDIEDGILGAEDLDVKWMGDPIWVRR